MRPSRPARRQAVADGGAQRTRMTRSDITCGFRSVKVTIGQRLSGPGRAPDRPRLPGSRPIRSPERAIRGHFPAIRGPPAPRARRPRPARGEWGPRSCRFRTALGRCRAAVGRDRAVGEQHRPDFSRSWSRADDVRCLCRRRRCRVALIITGGRFRPRCYISALSSSCADGRSRRRVTVIPESNAPSVPPLAWVLAIERYPHRAGGCGGAVVLCRPKRSACGCLRGSCPGDFPDNFYLEVLDRQYRRGRSLRASQGAWPPPDSNSMTLLLPCTHMLDANAGPLPPS